MTPVVVIARMRTSAYRVLFGLGLIVVSLFAEQRAEARQFELDFDGPEPSWQIRCRQNDARLDLQERRRDGARRHGSEFIRIQVARDNTPVRLEHKVPAARMIVDELTASLWVNSNRPGAVLAMRVSFLNTVDPATGVAMSTIVEGDKYDTPGKWQQLKCVASEKAVNDKLRLFRAKHKVSVDPASMYVEQVVVGCQFAPGIVELTLDDLELGPIVPMDDVMPISGTSDQNDQHRAANPDGSPAGILTETSPASVPVEFRLHKMRVEGKPFFPRIVPYRQEHPDLIRAAGLNVVWVPDHETITNVGQFRDRGIWLTTTPPFAKGASGEPLDSDDASLMPFSPSTSGVLFWMLGARLASDNRPKLASWANQIRDADRGHKRPLAADVVDSERIASRHVDMVGISRHVLNSTVSLGDFRDDIIRRRERAWPGTFCFTWIQTEPAAELMDLKQVMDETPVLEPEQIRAQVYAALAAGCRGIGFWTTTPLNSDAPGARERLLTMTILNLELSLLEPWLATGSTVQLIPFTVDTNTPPPKPRGATPAKPIPKPDKKTPEEIAAEKRKEREFSAAMIRTDTGTLLLPMWLEDRSQFVPAQASSYTATIIIPCGGGETATVWQIFATGRCQSLDRETVAGGIRVILKDFDQTAAIVVTPDPSIRDRINPQITAIQEQTANATVELCRLKLDRVRKVNDQLNQLGVKHSRAIQLLGEAKISYDKAEAALRMQQYHTAWQHARVAMRHVRILQRAHWEDAVAKLPSPVVSPFATSFQTLPAHWKLMRVCNAGESRSDVKRENRLPSGDFEDLDTMIAEHWNNEQRSYPDLQSSAELLSTAKQGKLALSLSVQPTVKEPNDFDFALAPLSVISPAVPAHAGQVVKISGWVKTPHPIVKSLDGALIYDSVVGKVGGVRILNAPDWQRFEFWRPLGESQPVTIHIEMHGLGEVLLDDLRITTTTLPADIAEQRGPDQAVRPAQHSPLDRFDLRRLSPLKRRD